MIFSNATEASDHCPLTLKLKMDLRGKRRFHFESFWLKLPGFLEEVAASWNQPAHCYCPLEKVSMKLKPKTFKMKTALPPKVHLEFESQGTMIRGLSGITKKHTIRKKFFPAVSAEDMIQLDKGRVFSLI